MSVRILQGDCFKVLASMPEASVDSIVTDPPYGLQFMGKEWDKLWRDRTAADVKWRDDNAGTLASRQRKLPDYSSTNPQQMQSWFLDWAKVAIRVLKPGGHMVAFGAAKNVHRLTCAIEDGGFEIRDVVMWLYGSGFPKSHNLDGQWEGWGTALKPAYEPIILARKPLIGTVAKNVLAHGVGALNIDGCRVARLSEADRASATPQGRTTAKSGALAGKVQHDGKRAEFERPDTSLGRWPANIVHDGSEEVVGAFPETQSGAFQRGDSARAEIGHNGIYGRFNGAPDGKDFGPANSGSAARFFYCAKASKKDRAGSKHPTVKPLALMRYLCRLITPPGGMVLDPFAGSGTTGQAATEEGFNVTLIEREDEYIADIRRRMGVEQPSAADMLA